MYIRKDIHKSLRLEAKMAEGANCFAWAKLFRECSFLLRKKDRENEKLRDRVAEAARMRAVIEDAVAWCERHDKEPYWLSDAYAALEDKQ